MDDIKDENSPVKKKIANSLESHYRQIRELYPRQYEAVKNYIEQLDELELKAEKNIDLVSGLTGQMLGEIFAYKEDEWAQDLRTLGFYLGKFIYIMDAYEDEPADAKHKRYNVLSQFTDSDDYEIYCRQLLTSMMAETAKIFERLPIVVHADILRNILYSGVWTRYELIQESRAKKKDKKAKKN